MKPVETLTKEEALGLKGVLFDLDDTVLTRGLLSRRAYDALWALSEAGVLLLAVTGRPASWGEILARQWPIAAALAENGAVALVRRGHGVVRVDSCSTEERARRRAGLAALVDEVKRTVPEAELTDDVHGRVTDVTWDIGENVQLAHDRVEAIAETVARFGARTTRSSVHIHGTFETLDKASGGVRYLVSQGFDAGRVLSEFAFVGDSGNDAACFSAFRTTFAVANVRAHLGRFSVTPKYVASAPMGDGFAEVARVLIERRHSVARGV